MNYQKSPRVKIIKNNIQKGESVPFADNDCTVGQWVDLELSERGHEVDKTGEVDLPEYKVDNKTRKKGSTASYTVGSMTISDIKETENWKDTRFYKKTLNQNQIEWDEYFQEVTDVTILDMDLPEIQIPLGKAYDSLRQQVLAGNTSKNIKSDCGWAVFDGYGHENSYRLRIPRKIMDKIKNLSNSRDTRKRFFEE